MEYLILYAFFCIIVGWIADYTTLGFGRGFLLSIIFTPVTGFIITLFYPGRKYRDEQNALLKKIASGSPQNEVDKMTLLHDRLEKLESMKQKNLINDDEYQRMRGDIMQSKTPAPVQAARKFSLSQDDWVTLVLVIIFILVLVVASFYS